MTMLMYYADAVVVTNHKHHQSNLAGEYLIIVKRRQSALNST